MGENTMLKDFNLLVTTARGNEEDACSEIWYLLGNIGDQAAEVDKTRITGLIVAKTIFDPFDVIEKLRNILKEKPCEFRFTLRVIPIEKVVHTDLNEIKEAIAELSSNIEESETFRVTVEKRFTTLSTKDIIEAAAVNIKHRVNLSNPNKVVLVEVVNGFTGVSIIKPTDVLSVMKERM